MPRLWLALGCIVVGALVGCGTGRLRDAHLSDPVVTADGTVWWAEHRARERGNEVRVIMCQRGARPVCVRIRPEDAPPR